MTELRNVKADLSRFRGRVFVIAAVVLLAFGLIAARLVYLQVVRHGDLSDQAENNRTAIVPIVPNRGLILDRKGVVLATNYSAYTLEVTPSKAGPIEETIDALAQVVDITPRDRRRFKKLMDESRNFESLPLRTRLTEEEVARIQSGTPLDWFEESNAICREIYVATPEGSDLSYDYIAKYAPVIERQLLRGGHRLAGLLNEIYG